MPNRSWKVLSLGKKEKSYAEVAKIYGKNESSISEIVKKGNKLVLVLI